MTPTDSVDTLEAPRITLRQLQVFCAVARTGSTVAAADAVALSQSAASASLGELERMLSLKLFERAGSGLLLNENGRELLPRALSVLDRALDLQGAGRDAGTRLQSLRIGASLTIADRVLPRLLAAWLGDAHREAEAWTSRVVVANTAAVCAQVAAFELDVGLVEGTVSAPSLIVVPWLRDELVLVGSKAAARRLAACDTPATMTRALRDEAWVMREPGSGTREAVDAVFLPRVRAWRRSIEIGSNEAIREAATAGVGIACLSRWTVADALASGRLVEIATPWRRAWRQCHRVMHRDKAMTAPLTRFVEQLDRAHGPRAPRASRPTRAGKRARA